MENLNIYPRSYLFVPSHQKKFFKNLYDYSCDCIIFDLEDAVPLNQKCEARTTLSKFLRSSNIVESKNILLRVNPVHSIFFESDLVFALSHGIFNVVIPKVNSQHDLTSTVDLARDSNFADNLKLYPLIETPNAVENVFNIYILGSSS